MLIRHQAITWTNDDFYQLDNEEHISMAFYDKFSFCKIISQDVFCKLSAIFSLSQMCQSCTHPVYFDGLVVFLASTKLDPPLYMGACSLQERFIHVNLVTTDLVLPTVFLKMVHDGKQSFKVYNCTQMLSCVLIQHSRCIKWVLKRSPELYDCCHRRCTSCRGELSHSNQESKFMNGIKLFSNEFSYYQN